MEVQITAIMTVIELPLLDKYAHPFLLSVLLKSPGHLVKVFVKLLVCMCVCVCLWNRFQVRPHTLLRGGGYSTGTLKYRVACWQTFLFQMMAPGHDLEAEAVTHMPQRK